MFTIKGNAYPFHRNTFPSLWSSLQTLFHDLVDFNQLYRASAVMPILNHISHNGLFFAADDLLHFRKSV